MKRPPKILMIEDDSSIASSLQRILVQRGYEVLLEARGDDGFRRATEDAFDMVLTDFKLPGLSGLDLIRKIRQSKPRLPIILMTAHGTTETAIEATKHGAYEYLLKPFEIPELLGLVEKAVESCRLMSEPVELGEANPRFDALVGKSRAMQVIYKEIGRVAAKPVDVLICGETGTGKELIARAIYQHSDRAGQPFITVNCAAIPDNLLESELFGYERGAFTGAETRRIGRFEQAHQGTILLDEIGDMSAANQVKLLRVLQEKNIQRLGGKEDIPTDVRVIAATHFDLEQAVADKRFRDDLYFRLNVVLIQVPPLRNHLEDIPDLTNYFLLKHGPALGDGQPSIQADAFEELSRHHWPGNVRELENVIRKAILSARGYSITREVIASILSRRQNRAPSLTPGVQQFVAELMKSAQAGEVENVYAAFTETVERELFSRAIEAAAGNQSKAAEWLGISRITMREKLLHYGIHPSQPKS